MWWQVVEDTQDPGFRRLPMQHDKLTSSEGGGEMSLLHTAGLTWTGWPERRGGAPLWADEERSAMEDAMERSWTWEQQAAEGGGGRPQRRVQTQGTSLSASSRGHKVTASDAPRQERKAETQAHSGEWAGEPKGPARNLTTRDGCRPMARPRAPWRCQVCGGPGLPLGPLWNSTTPVSS